MLVNIILYFLYRTHLCVAWLAQFRLFQVHSLSFLLRLLVLALDLQFFLNLTLEHILILDSLGCLSSCELQLHTEVVISQ